MTRLTKYEKETIILTSEGDDTYNVFTYNSALKRRLADFAKKYPAVCYLENEDRTYGSQSYVIDKGRLSIRLTAPYSEERRKAARDNARGQKIGKTIEKQSKNDLSVSTDRMIAKLKSRLKNDCFGDIV